MYNSKNKKLTDILGGTKDLFYAKDIKEIQENIKGTDTSLHFLSGESLTYYDFFLPLLSNDGDLQNLSDQDVEVEYSDILTTENSVIYVVENPKKILPAVKLVINKLITDRKVYNLKLPENIRFILKK